MAEGQPIFEQDLCYTADEFRNLPNVAREGVIDPFGGSLLVASSGAADHSVTIAAGSAWVAADGTGITGMYRVENDASVTVQLPAGGGGNSRVDTIVATVRDSEASGVDNDWVLTSLDGTPSASAALTDAGIAASAAAVPVMTLVLGYVLVPAADTLTTTISGANVLDARSNYQSSDVEPFIQLAASAATSIPNTAYTKVDLATTVWRDRDYFSVSASVVTVLRSGLYRVTGRAAFGGGSAGNRYFAVGKNGVTDKDIAHVGTASGTGEFFAFAPDKIPLAANDTLQLCGFQTGQANLNTLHGAGGDGISRLTISKVG